MNRVKLYIEGVCTDRGEAGGWACILYNDCAGTVKELSGSSSSTTKTQMLLTALLEGLKLIPQDVTSIELYCSSEYIIQSLKKGIVWEWQNHEWHKENGFRVPDSDLWSEILKHISVRESSCEMEFHTIRNSERAEGSPEYMCDLLATQQSRGASYENFEYVQKPIPSKRPLSAGNEEQYIITMRVAAPNDITIGALEEALHREHDVNLLETLFITRVLGDTRNQKHQQEALTNHCLSVCDYTLKTVRQGREEGVL